jgi:hypothetical protein
LTVTKNKWQRKRERQRERGRWAGEKKEGGNPQIKEKENIFMKRKT